jgi:hypothetical protein
VARAARAGRTSAATALGRALRPRAHISPTSPTSKRSRFRTRSSQCPRKTLAAFADHGRPRLARVEEHAARQTIGRLARERVDLEAVGAELEADGLRSFAAAYSEILERLEVRAATIAADAELPAAG